MAEDYISLAANFEDNTNLLIAEMDWTKHKTDAVQIKGFSTIIYFKKGGEKPEQIEFSGARKIFALIEFLKETAGSKLNRFHYNNTTSKLRTLILNLVRTSMSQFIKDYNNTNFQGQFQIILKFKYIDRRVQFSDLIEYNNGLAF
ncbi:unnamed protein product [Paramecium octaurelia]|uniref:Uncharacterized protein n=1 Tax=Paramecium octaurelia TaxID=43137 RepID=A0A8S1WQ19_PAROT|nr:unnamed protein product [Paramecium octaurelia]